jgi:NACalpha-BTF3-like transcription factor
MSTYSQRFEPNEMAGITTTTTVYVDVELVAHHCKCSFEVAQKLVTKHQGNLINAVMDFYMNNVLPSIRANSATTK